MISYLGPAIFWKTIASAAAILSLATIIGRAWSMTFAYRFRAFARFYLAPVLGLATLTIIAIMIGRNLHLGTSAVVPLVTFALLVLALILEQRITQAFAHAFVVSMFGIICGTSLLLPLFLFGAFNAHNDAFTYLAHATWLQEHAFRETIPPNLVTPLTTQVAAYQRFGFRMGASFLLAFVQALFKLRWSYEAYPAVVIAALAVGLFAMGFPLVSILRPVRRNLRLALLTIPAFTLGGLVFGANFGFLPQLLGLAFGASLLFAVGPMLPWFATLYTSWFDTGKAAIPCAFLLAGAVFAYSELAPFLLVALIAAFIVSALKSRARGNVLVYGGVMFGLSILLLNTELMRVYSALRIQSSAVVGTPVEWSLLGYVAHALGLHGGAWDVLQWTSPERTGSLSFFFGLLLLAMMIGVMVAGLRSVWSATLRGILMPVIVILILFMSGVMYFRYFVPSPFPKGVGQSWSQFKLADWAHPFVMLLFLYMFASLQLRWGKLFHKVVVALFLLGMVTSTHIGVARIRPLMHYYRGVSDLNQFYITFRNTVLNICQDSTPIHLALGGEDHKFREMALLYLHDQQVTSSDWTDDGYIYPWLPSEGRSQELTLDSCVVEPVGQSSYLNESARVGPFHIGIFSGHGVIRISAVTGAHDQETDGKNWWYWVEHGVRFTLQPILVSSHATRTRLRFEYATRGKQTLTVHVVDHNGLLKNEFALASNGEGFSLLDRVIDMAPNGIALLSVQTDGSATPLGNGDPRMAAWIIRDVKIAPSL
jgi:hypothetical protein